MGRYATAAHKAYQAASQQAETMPCLCPGNNLIYAFLEEVRRIRQAVPETAARAANPAGHDNFGRSIKMALDSLRDYPLRIYDVKSAQDVKGIGAAVAKMIEEELFKEYPPRPPTTHEIEQYRAAREALKQAAKRKATASVDPGPSAPGKEILPTSGDMTLPDVPANANVLQQTEDTRGNLTATATGTDGARKKSRVAAVYIPNIGTANFAFLIVLFQAQKGPERLEYLGKDDLMNRAEASGLADKPIQGEGNPARGSRNPRFFYNGWSSLKTLVNKGLVQVYSNPKKVALVPSGLELAEKLYRDAVNRGRAKAVPGLPVNGPMLYQQEERSPQQAAADAAQARATAGLRNDAVLAAALRVNTRSTAVAAVNIHSQTVTLPHLNVPLAERLGLAHTVRPPKQAQKEKRKNEVIFLDLASSTEGEEEEVEEERPASVSARVPSPLGGAPADDQAVAQMVEMGFSDRKARKALRLSGTVDLALDVITILSSDEETSGDEGDEVILGLPSTRRAAAVAGNASSSSYCTAVVTESGPALGHIRTSSQAARPRPRIGGQSQSQSQGTGCNVPAGPAGTKSGGMGSFHANAVAASAGADVSTVPDYGLSQWWIDSNNVRLPPLPPGRRFGDEYEVLLLVDGREQYSRGANNASRTAALSNHLQSMQSSGLAVEQRVLPIGDALWVARSRRAPSREYVLDYILERKSLSDLLSSIRESSRYSTQKYFLKRCDLRHVYYLIEGDTEVLGEGSDHKVVTTAAARTEIQDGFRVLRTKGFPETFRLYQSLTQSISRLYGDLSRDDQARSDDASTTTSMTFDAFKTFMRKCSEGATTVHDIWGKTLAEVPGLGPEAITAVLKAYPTPSSLWKAYREAMKQGKGSVAAPEALLTGVKTESGRNIGPEKSRKVYQMLFMDRWNLEGRV